MVGDQSMDSAHALQAVRHPRSTQHLTPLIQQADVVMLFRPVNTQEDHRHLLTHCSSRRRFTTTYWFSTPKHVIPPVVGPLARRRRPALSLEFDRRPGENEGSTATGSAPSAYSGRCTPIREELGGLPENPLGDGFGQV